MTKFTKLFISLTALVGCCSSYRHALNEDVVTDFNLGRYLGKWYEIARFDHSFERGLSHVTAEYTLRGDGKVKVLNSGLKPSGILNTATGKAKYKQKGTGKLKVAFFWEFYAPYNILMLDKDYSYALVSSGRDYLWILSRSPKIDSATLTAILLEAELRGFDTSQLLYVDQS